MRFRFSISLEPMPAITSFWVVPVLLLAGPAYGQETDSLFFRPDSLLVPAVGQAKSGQPGVVHRRESADPFMQTRIAYTGDFIRRLNDPGGSDSQRSVRIRLLFDNEDPRLTRRETGGYDHLIDRFIDDMGAAVTGLPTDPNEQLYAVVGGRVTWQQQEHPITFCLKKHRTDLNWAWEIIGAETKVPLSAADPTELSTRHREKPPPDSAVFIAPNAHELNFMGLAKQLRAGQPLESFIGEASANDPQLTTVAHHLATGRLRLETLLTTTLWLNTQRGWWLQLRQFNRDSDNSGWLISDLCRTDDGHCLPVLLRRFTTH